MTYSIDELPKPKASPYIESGGIYKGKIVSAYDAHFKELSRGVCILFKSDELYAPISLITISKKGNPTKGLNTLKDLMYIHDIFDLKNHEADILCWDYRRKKVSTRFEKAFLDLTDKEFILELAVQRFYTGRGYRINYTIINAFNPKTNQTASEMAQNIQSVVFKIAKGDKK